MDDLTSLSHSTPTRGRWRKTGRCGEKHTILKHIIIIVFIIFMFVFIINTDKSPNSQWHPVNHRILDDEKAHWITVGNKHTCVKCVTVTSGSVVCALTTLTRTWTRLRLRSWRTAGPPKSDKPVTTRTRHSVSSCVNTHTHCFCSINPLISFRTYSVKSDVSPFWWMHGGYFYFPIMHWSRTSPGHLRHKQTAINRFCDGHESDHGEIISWNWRNGGKT